MSGAFGAMGMRTPSGLKKFGTPSSSIFTLQPPS